MKKKLVGILLVVAMICNFSACGQEEADSQITDSKDYTTGSPWINSNILSNIENRDDIPLKDDFDAAINRDWVMSNPIKSGKTAKAFLFGFEDTLNERLFGILTDNTMSGSHEGEITQKLYNSFLDWDKRDKEGVTALMPYLEEIEAIKSYDDFASFSSEDDFSFSQIVEPQICSNPIDTSQKIIAIFTPSIFLKDVKDYEDLDNMSDYTKQVYDSQKKKVEIVLKKCGYDETKINTIYDEAIEFEKLFSQYCYTLDESYLSETMQTVYGQQYSEEQLSKYKWFDIVKDYIDAAGITNVPSYILYDKIDYFDHLDDICAESNLSLMKSYLLAHTAANAIGKLDKECFYAALDISNKLNGVTGYKEENQYALDIVSKSLGWPLSKLYCEKYVTPEDRQNIYNLIKDIVSAYEEMLSSEEFLSEATRKEAVNKLEHIRVNCMYPDEWKDYASLSLSDSYFENSIAITYFNYEKELAEFNDPVDKDEWADTPITMNAFYDSYNNSINILPGLIGDVLYSSDMSKEEIYAMAGVVIGHEISHAFDPSGSTFDYDGNYKNWWTDEDYTRFNELTKKLVAYYDNIKVWDDFMCNGEMVKTEACADMAGVSVMLKLGSKIENFDYDKFFRAYAKLWAQNSTPEYAYNLGSYDSHPLSYLRVNATVAQYDEFYETYDIKEGDGMYIAPEDRVKIW